MIEIIIIISFIVLFIHVTLWPGMIFASIGEKLKVLPEFIRKPLYDCPICMTPYYGSLILWMGNVSKVCRVHNPVQWIFILFAAAGVNTVLIYIVDAGKAITKALNDMDCNCTKKETEEEKSAKRKERISNYKGIEHLSNID